LPLRRTRDGHLPGAADSRSESTCHTRISPRHSESARLKPNPKAAAAVQKLVNKIRECADKAPHDPLAISEKDRPERNEEGRFAKGRTGHKTEKRLPALRDRQRGGLGRGRAPAIVNGGFSTVNMRDPLRRPRVGLRGEHRGRVTSSVTFGGPGPKCYSTTERFLWLRGPPVTDIANDPVQCRLALLRKGVACPVSGTCTTRTIGSLAHEFH